MKKLVQLFLSLLFLSSCTSNDEPRIDVAYNVVDPVPTTDVFTPAPSEMSIIESMPEAAFFYSKILAPQDEDDNYCISPLSLNFAVAMVANSVDDESGDLIAERLGAASVGDLNSLYNKQISYLTHPSTKSKLLLANAVWHSDKYEVSDLFTTRMATLYGASVTPFAVGSRAAVDMINSWVRNTTQGVIPDIIESATSEFYWSNTLYFQSNWMYKFDPAKTTAGVFHGTKGDAEVDMMHGLQENATYCEYAGAVYAKIYYKLIDYTFELIMSDEPIDYQLYKDLSDGRAMQFLYDLEMSLPKFSIMTDLDITPLLGELGVMDSDVMLSGMGLPSVPGMIQGGKQKTRIDVDEEGVKITAATIIGGVGCADNEKHPFVVDRPFTFIVREARTGAILLMGRVNNI